MLFFFTMGASNPLLPKFVVDDLGGSEATAGLVMGSFAVAALLTRSGFGRLGGRRGSRLLLIIGCAVAMVGMLLLAVAADVATASAARRVMGTGQAAAMTGSTVLAIDLAPEARRGEASSYILTAFHLGLGTGPLVGEALQARTSYDTVWLLLTVPLALGLAIAWKLPNRAGDPDAPPSPWIHPHGIAPGVVVAFGMVPFIAFSVFVPLYGREVGLDSVGTVFMVSSISIAAVRLLLSRLPDALGPINAGPIAVGFVTVGAIVAALWAAPAGMYVAAATVAGGMALQTPALIPVAVNGVEPHDRASAMATFTMFMDLSVALTGPVFGLIVGGGGYRLTYLVAAATSVPALAVLHLVLAPRWRKVHAQPAIG